MIDCRVYKRAHTHTPRRIQTRDCTLDPSKPLASPAGSLLPKQDGWPLVFNIEDQWHGRSVEEVVALVRCTVICKYMYVSNVSSYDLMISNVAKGNSLQL